MRQTHYKSSPFPFLVMDGYLNAETVAQINREWPSDMQREDGRFQRKLNCHVLSPAAQALRDNINTDQVARWLGIKEPLFVDPENFGGGHHEIEPGGYLDMHVDFNRHPMGWYRRVNMLFYFNRDWRPEWKGQLLLGEHREIALNPIAGRLVMFETTENSWHGHPEPLACPPGITRRSLAFYLYSMTQPPGPDHSTIYKKR